MRNTFSEVFRTTFPKKLRFDQGSQILYAQCYSISRQYRNKKYIPLSAVENVLAQYTYVPYHPWLRLPVIRHILCVRVINSVRHYCGKASWLYNKGLEEEYEKIKTWCDKQTAQTIKNKSGAQNRGGHPSTTRVLRERFDREVLNRFYVATMYQRMARLLIYFCIFLLIVAVVSVYVDTIAYLFIRFKGWKRDEVKQWFRQILLRHAATDVPPAYAHLLPLPCVVRRLRSGEKELAVSVVELVHEKSGISVLAIPAPQMGEKSFFSRLGRICSECDAVIMEGVSFEQIDRLIPPSLLPLKENTFPALGVHHRFLDILQSDREPPMLFPGGSRTSWRTFLKQVYTPFEVQCVYQPTALTASKGEAKVGWGRLRQLIEQRSREQEASPEPYVIGLPWTMQHIVNIEASLIKFGFKVKRVFVLPWITEDFIGDHFCDYFHIS